MSGKASKAAGSRGERLVRNYLEAQNWLPVDKETSGLAGDDVFMADPDGVYWSIEVKHVQALNNTHMAQAIRQSAEREDAVKSAKPNSVARRLGVTHKSRNWILVWVPKNWRNTHQMLAVKASGVGARFELWEV